MIRPLAVIAGLALLVPVACGGSGPPAGTRPAGTAPATTAPATTAPATTAPASTAPASTAPAAAFTLTSAAFRGGGDIPRIYSCFGANESPPLAWRGVPAGTVGLALVVDDPDAVGGRYLHWLVVGIPPDTASIPAGRTPSGATVLPNSSGDAAYLGPCPPAGTGAHHYRFTLYALREQPHLVSHPKALAAEAAIKNAAAASVRLVGRFGR